MQYHRAIELRPDYWEAHFELAGQLVLEGKIPEAEKEFAEVVRLRPDYALGHFNLAVAFMKQNQLAEARREFQETLRLEPTNKIALAGLRQVEGKGK